MRRAWRRGSGLGRGYSVVGFRGLRQNVAGFGFSRLLGPFPGWRSRVLVLCLGLVPRLALKRGDDAVPGCHSVHGRFFDVPGGYPLR